MRDLCGALEVVRARGPTSSQAQEVSSPISSVAVTT